MKKHKKNAFDIIEKCKTKKKDFVTWKKTFKKGLN